MGALTKLCSHFRKHTAIFFAATLPRALRLAVLTVHVFWISYKRARVKCNFAALINKQSSKFVYRRKGRRRRRPHEGKDEEEEEDLLSCSICLSEFVDGEEGRELRICKHIFHGNCIEKWLHGNQGTCPLCRNVLLPKEIVAEHQRLQNEQAADDHNREEEVELALLFLSAVHGRNCHRFTIT